eukprot:32978-Rhodomonas_salina.1
MLRGLPADPPRSTHLPSPSAPPSSHTSMRNRTGSFPVSFLPVVLHPPFCQTLAQHSLASAGGTHHAHP